MWEWIFSRSIRWDRLSCAAIRSPTTAGYVEFETIVPGWEIVAAAPPVVAARRTTHIHVKAFHGREVLTAQLYFPDQLIDELYTSVEPYKSHQLLTAPGLTRSYERIRNARGHVLYRAASRSQ